MKKILLLAPVLLLIYFSCSGKSPSNEEINIAITKAIESTIKKSDNTLTWIEFLPYNLAPWENIKGKIKLFSVSIKKIGYKQEEKHKNFWPAITELEFEYEVEYFKSKKLVIENRKKTIVAEFFLSKEPYYGDWAAKFSKQIKD